jgi:hypothetical protein
MKANVYALIEVRTTTFDLYMVCASQEEALGYYQRKTGKLGAVDEVREVDGHMTWALDGDSDGGAAYISQYKVGIKELLDE